jgi:hypothetical protein
MVKMMTSRGDEVASQGDIGFVCVVVRGFAAPPFTPRRLRELVYQADLRVPICYDPLASRTVLTYGLLGDHEPGGSLPFVSDDAGVPTVD